MATFVQCGESLALAGEAFAEAGNSFEGLVGTIVFTEDADIALSNGSIGGLLATLNELENDDIIDDAIVFVQAGERLAQAGEALAEAGNSDITFHVRVNDIAGTLNELEDIDIITANGVIDGLLATLNITEDIDIIFANGTTGSLFGTLNALENDDIIDDAIVFVQAGERLAQAGEVFAEAGNSDITFHVRVNDITGTLNELEDIDIITANGVIDGLLATLSITEDIDIIVANGTTGSLFGTLNELEDDDIIDDAVVFVQSGELLAQAGEAFAEAGNSDITFHVRVDDTTGTLNALEDIDIIVANGGIGGISATLNALEDIDIITANGTIEGIVGVLTDNSNNDDIAANGFITSHLTGVLTDNSDIDIITTNGIIEEKIIESTLLFLNVFKHLLPNARAWRLTVNKQLRQFFDALSKSLGDKIKEHFDDVWLDLFPQTTRALDEWEQQFGLRDTGLTEQERRDRLAASWQALGGQDPIYIQETLQASGFDVYVHEWWAPGTEPAPDVKLCVTPRDPNNYILDDSGRVTFITGAGEPLMEAGEAIAEAGERSTPPGYLLVNKVFETTRNLLSLAGEPLMEAGGASALSGDYSGFSENPVKYFIPSDANTWRYFLYIGGQTFGNLAQVDPKRKDEFETLCLKICPAQQWLGILVEYT